VEPVPPHEVGFTRDGGAQPTSGQFTQSWVVRAEGELLDLVPLVDAEGHDAYVGASCSSTRAGSAGPRIHPARVVCVGDRKSVVAAVDIRG
jgi:hypothetical protein